jgi:hypothetical protein
MNNLNPSFTKPIDIDYHFENVQKLLFSVFDIDNESSRLDDEHFLGQMECNLGQVGTGNNPFLPWCLWRRINYYSTCCRLYPMFDIRSH